MTAGVTAPTTGDRLDALARSDKWYLSCGDGIVWAPPFPQWLSHPGFWDEALVYYHPFAPLFTVALVGPTGEAAALERGPLDWRPDGLTVQWRAQRAELIERRFALPGGEFVSHWEPAGATEWPSSLRDWHLVAFSVQPWETVQNLRRDDARDVLTWGRTLIDRHEHPLQVQATIAAAGAGTAALVSARRSEPSAMHPLWRLTPFWEEWREQSPPGLAGEVCLGGVETRDVVYVALDVPLADAGEVSFALRLEPETRKGRVAAQGNRDPRSPWVEFFDGFPRFTCSNQHLTRYYDYRVFGLRLNRLDGDAGNVRHPAIAEGIGYFHVPITYSGQCHMREMRWSRTPDVAHGTLLNFLDAQRQDGSLHGRLYTNHLEDTDFYHADWGDAVLAVDAVHDDEEFLETAYGGLSRYARWLDTTRDREASCLYDVVNQYETGQEYMARYQAVDDRADMDGRESGLRLKGVDVTVYTYQLKQTLAVMADRLCKGDESAEWRGAADRIGAAILEHLWDDECGFFFDVDPRTMRRTGAKAAVGFYPLLTDLVGEEHVRALVAHLENPEEFGSPYPIPSSSLDDAYFAGQPLWKGKRHNCPWNGRVWPMVNSHVIDGLLRQWRRGRRAVGPVAGRLLVRFVEMMFDNGDVHRPNCFEHYNPFTGQASVYRGIDDYQHSWVLDLLLRGVAGIVPGRDGIAIDPLTLELDDVTVEHAVVRGHDVTVMRKGSRVTATVDGDRYETEVGTPVEIGYT